MLYLDIKYASMVGMSLPLFKVTKNNPYTATFRCPICGDSKKNRHRTRGYFYITKGLMSFKCHNCGESKSFMGFLKHHNPTLYKEYSMEKFIEKGKLTPKKEPEQFKTENRFEPKGILDMVFDRCDKLDDDHIAVKYLAGRQIPIDKYRNLYYINNIADIDKLNPKYAAKMKDKEPRIIIPCYARDGRLLGIDCRALTDEGLRYVKIKLTDREVDMVYNLNKVDYTKTVYVTEGQFDAMFIPNAIAFGNASLHMVRRVLQYDVDVVLVYDNEPRNKEVCKQIHKGVQNFPTVIWPDTLEEGMDINKMILNGMTIEQVMSMINMNTYAGLSAEAAFRAWRKS
jgi:hypothetical protein